MSTPPISTTPTTTGETNFGPLASLGNGGSSAEALAVVQNSSSANVGSAGYGLETTDIGTAAMIDTSNTSSATLTSPKSRGVNDISDIHSTTTMGNIAVLPIRAEKRIIPKLATSIPQGLGTKAWASSHNDFFVTAAKRAYAKDYVKVRLPHRGVNPTTLQADPTQSVEFRFLINPASISVNRQTVDTQSLTRGGWQFGVWGEDVFMVQMSGQSAGSYFTKGLTDRYAYYAESYRNLMQLQQVFENNGYWFEGEEANEGPLAADYLRRRIRVHQDVELWVGNFIWFGMFDSLTISQPADHPFTLNFQLSFLAWKERYRSSSPYWASITNNVQRGHSYSAAYPAQAAAQTISEVDQFSPMAISDQVTVTSTPTPSAAVAALGNTGAIVTSSTLTPQSGGFYTGSPAVAAANVANSVSTQNTLTMETGGAQSVGNMINTTSIASIALFAPSTPSAKANPISYTPQL